MKQEISSFIKQTWDKTFFKAVKHGLMVSVLAMLDKTTFRIILWILGEYFVVGVDIEQYDEENPDKYLKGLLRDETHPVAQKAFHSYIGVVPSSPVGFENFTVLVNSYMERPPFNFPNPLTYFGIGKRVSISLDTVTFE